MENGIAHLIDAPQPDERYIKKPVDVSIIRALYGIVESERATGGIVVTTSSFTKGAVNFQKTVENRLWLKDYNNLIVWLNNKQSII